MHSFLIVSKNPKTAIDYAIKLCTDNGIDQIDLVINSFEKTAGVEDVKNLKKKIILKPIKSKTKAVILDGTNGITIQAQNALLKLLEEPPQHTLIYLAVPNKELMLPTILSRCEIINLKDNPTELSREETAQYFNILISLLSIGVGDRLKLAQDITKNKEDVVPWLEKMIIVARQTLLTNYKNEPTASDQRPKTKDYVNILISFQKTHIILKTTNVNPRLALENLFLNIY